MSVTFFTSMDQQAGRVAVLIISGPAELFLSSLLKLDFWKHSE